VIDVGKLRAIADISHERVTFEEAYRLHDAMPELLAVYKAVHALREARPAQYDGVLPTDIREFLTAVDAARGDHT